MLRVLPILPRKFSPSIAVRLVHVTEYGIKDGLQELLHVETRNMCRCEECFSTLSTQKLLTDAKKGVRVSSVGRVTEHYLTVKWDDGHEGMIARTSRGAYGPQPVQDILDKYYNLTVRRNNELQLWRGEEEEGVAMQFKYSDVISSDQSTRDFIAHFMKYGIGTMTEVPAERNTLDVINVDMEAGPMRETIYKNPDPVAFIADAHNFAYTSDALPGHTDLPYYTQMPQIFLFRCHINTVIGGSSFWIDTFAALAEVRAERPDYFASLTTTPISFRYSPPGTGWYLATPYTAVVLMGDDILEVRDSLGLLDEFEMSRRLPRETRSKWWDAFLYYQSKLEQAAYKRIVKAGDLVFVDNRRVLHGRESFKAEGERKERLMDVSYGDWNHFQRRLLDTGPEKLFIERHLHNE